MYNKCTHWNKHAKILNTLLYYISEYGINRHCQFQNGAVQILANIRNYTTTKPLTNKIGCVV